MKHVIREEKLRHLTFHWMLTEGILKKKAITILN